MRKTTLWLLFIIFASCSLPFSEKTEENSQTSGQQSKSTRLEKECSNELLPIKVGASWTYKIDYHQKQMQPVEMTKAIASAEENSFITKYRFTSPQIPATNLEGKIECNNGNIKAHEPKGLGSLYTDTKDFQANYKVLFTEGVTLPAKVKQGDQWSYTVELQVDNPTLDEKIEEMKGKIVSNCNAQGKETIKVQAGTFEAIKVTCNVDIISKIQNFETKFTSIENSWYAPGVGVVKTVSSLKEMTPKPKFPNLPDFTSSELNKPTETELISYNIP